jgi:hypothetical protein
LLLEVAVVGFHASHRGVNADEGFYLAAAQHVADGQRLYADVFFPQMPYLPWALAGVFGWVEPSLAVGRALSVAAAALSAALLVWIVWRDARDVLTTLLAALLFIASALMINSLAVTKTAALVNLCLLGAYGPLALGLAQRPLWAFVAGLSAGIGIGVRLPIAAVVPVFLILAARCGVRSLVAFAAGGLLASLPWMIAALRSGEQFWFCNVTFHQLRREIGGWAIVRQKIGVLGKWLFLPQHILLWGLAAVSLWRWPRRVWPAAACAIVLAFGYAAATPTYLEYMSHFSAFLVLAAVPALGWIAQRRRLAAALAGLYVIAAYPLVKHDVTTSARAEERALWSLHTVNEVSAFVNAHTDPDGRVLSWWEGYPFLSRRPAIPGVGFWESNVAKKISPELARRYHVAQRDDLLAIVRSRSAAVIVVPDDTWQYLRPDIEAGYRVASRVGPIQIYARSS